MKLRHVSLLLPLLAWAAVSRAAAAEAAPLDPPSARELLSTASVGTVYSNGDLAWRSWSWGLASLNQKDAGAPMPGSRLSLCLTVQPFGALSLRSNGVPFTLEGSVLGFFIRGSGNMTAEALGGLELQFESSSPSRYAITRSVTLAEALAAQAAAGGPAADEALAGIAAGTWTAVKLPLADFARPDGALAGGSGGSGAVAAGSFRADRLTIGLCLQRLDGCGQDTPSLSFCLDKLVIVNAA